MRRLSIRLNEQQTYDLTVALVREALQPFIGQPLTRDTLGDMRKAISDIVVDPRISVRTNSAGAVDTYVARWDNPE